MKLNNKINKKEILKYLGYNNQELTAEFQAELDAAINEIVDASGYKNVWNCLARKDLEKILIGKDINAHLGNAERVVLLAVTLGQSVDYILRRSQNVDIKKSVILDATASVVIETYLDEIEEQLREKFLQDNLYLSTRFSPGYGDMPLSVQEDLLNILNTNRRIGVHVTNNGLMSPMKSVTCIMAVLDKPIIEAKDPCSICQLQGNCALRRNGGFCGRFRK